MQSSYLLVNADDYAYFPGVSQGILDAHKNGIVTATGILANGFSFAEDVKLLRSRPNLDSGVHLNLTFGKPLTGNMRTHFRTNGENFMAKSVFARMFIAGTIPLQDIRAEWCAQIEKTMQATRRIWFLNSHEHVHLFPSLFKLVHELADEYSIPYVRRPTARILESFEPGHIVRSAIVKILASINGARSRGYALEFLGFGKSGRLSAAYLKGVLRELRPGKIYELMCHPGYEEGVDSGFADLRQYHDWDLEVATLTDPEIRAVCEEERVEIIGYRDIEKIARESWADRRGPRH